MAFEIAGGEDFEELGGRLAGVASPEAWSGSDHAARRRLAHRLHRATRSHWGLPHIDLAIADFGDPAVWGAFDPESGEVTLNESLLDGEIDDVVGTIVHENRHALQADVIDGVVEHPLTPDPIADEEKSLWEQASEDYDPDDLLEYMYSPLETDARASESGALVGYWKTLYLDAGPPEVTDGPS